MVVASYDGVRRNIDRVKAIPWLCVIADEAHRLKSDKTNVHPPCPDSEPTFCLSVSIEKFSVSIGQHRDGREDSIRRSAVYLKRNRTH